MFSKAEEDRKFFLERLEVAAKQLPHVSEYWHKASGTMQLAEESFGVGKLRNALRLAEEASDLNDAHSGRRRHIQGVNDLHFKRGSLLEREGVRLIASLHWVAMESSEPDESPLSENDEPDEDPRYANGEPDESPRPKIADPDEIPRSENGASEVVPDAPPTSSRVVLWIFVLGLLTAFAWIAAKALKWF